MSLHRMRAIGALLAGLAMATPASAAIVQLFQQSAFQTAQQSGEPILVFVEAPWCPVCAKERPILAQLYDTPEFERLQVFTVDFDTSKTLLRAMGVQMQSTLVVFHGAKETARATGLTDPAKIKALLETSQS